MALSPEEVAARIKAARLLRGVSQQELADALAADGLAARLVGALERGETELRPVHRRALCGALGMPERWFTDPVDELVPQKLPNGWEERYERIEGMLLELLERWRESR